MNKTLLIIEDDEDIVNIYKKLLSGLNVKFLRAFNGEDALSIIDSGEIIDLILLDLIMPVMDGIQFLKILRSERHSKIPVIPCSGDEKTMIKLRENQKISDFFSKLQSYSALKDKVK
jgi:CheY-like chemotaxis protein